MSNTTTTTLQGKALLLAQLELVTPTTVDGTLYGIAFTLFCLYAHFLTPQLRGKDKKWRAKFMLGYSSIIMLCGLFYLVTKAWLVQDGYIKHSNYPGGPFAYELTIAHMPAMITMIACEDVIDILTLAIQIWRVWVIWSSTRYALSAIALPSLCLVALIALRLRTAIIIATHPIKDLAQLDSKTEIVACAIQGAITILCTTLISLYLIFQRRCQRKLIGKAQGSIRYMDIVSMLIESYAMESIWLLLIVILWGHVFSIFFSDSSAYIEIIAYLLIQYRVARGTAYESQRGEGSISSLRWNRPDHATTQFGETSEPRDSPCAHADPEAPEKLPASSMA